jgi:hypothetical protein
MSTADASWSPVGEVSVPTAPVVRVWMLALATYGVGDGVTTAALVWASPLHREANPVVSAAIDSFGGSGLVGLKILAIGVCLAISYWGRTDDDRFTVLVPPVTLVLTGTATTLVNLSLLW